MRRISLFVVLAICGIFAGIMLLRAKPAKTQNLADISREVNGKSIESMPAPDTATQPVTPPLAHAPGSQDKVTDSSARKVEILDEVFKSKNDNDPRLDSEFRNLSDEDKAVLERKYDGQEKERLNERGTIVFLLGREIKDSKDLTFFKQVAGESPCEDFTNCHTVGKIHRDNETGADDVTLAYPQIMALKSLDNFLKSSPQDPTLKNQAVEIVNTASQSSNILISQMAAQILEGSN